MKKIIPNVLVTSFILLLFDCSKSQSGFNYSLKFGNIETVNHNNFTVCVNWSCDNVKFTQDCDYVYQTVVTTPNNTIEVQTKTPEYKWVGASNKYTVTMNCGNCELFSANLYLNSTLIATKSVFPGDSMKVKFSNF